MGASIVVYRRTGQDLQLLMLHRAHLGVDFEGPWAWTPPASARQPDETVEVCARRELLEETSLTLEMYVTTVGAKDQAIYVAELLDEQAISLDTEHDRFEWLSAAAPSPAPCQSTHSNY